LTHRNLNLYSTGIYARHATLNKPNKTALLLRSDFLKNPVSCIILEIALFLVCENNCDFKLQTSVYRALPFTGCFFSTYVFDELIFLQ